MAKLTSLQRIASILKAKSLGQSVTGLTTFKLTLLDLPKVPDFELPGNLRLGHLAERIVSELIRSSSNYQVLYEGLQIQENEKTIGEIDFIVQDHDSGLISHVELAYKFYLYDPSISSHLENNWIGPNRNDTLSQKLAKLKSKQFPLLSRDGTRATLSDVDVDEMGQSLCLIALLFTPYDLSTPMDADYESCVKGFYLNVEAFRALDHKACRYYVPSKREWGIEPTENQVWEEYKEIESTLDFISEEKQSLLCWKKQNDTYEQFFITWW